MIDKGDFKEKMFCPNCKKEVKPVLKLHGFVCVNCLGFTKYTDKCFKEKEK